MASTDDDTAAAAWHTYLAVDDADATAAAVRAAGGQVAAEPEDAGPGGRAASCVDPAGATFRLWQARRRLGAQVVNVPGAWNFSDLHTPSAAAALRFYGPLFGWEHDHRAAGAIRLPGYGDHLAATTYPDIHEVQAGMPEQFADAVAGLVEDGSNRSAGWRLRFAVADRDASAATAERLGGTVVHRDDDRWTRTALVRDPQGAEFTVSQFTPPD